MTLRWLLLATGLASLGGCAHRPSPQAGPLPVGSAGAASPQQLDSLWHLGTRYSTSGSWKKAANTFERLLLESPPGDRRIPGARFRLAESYLAMKSHLQATREFRRVSDDTPNDPLAPEALLRAGDAYADLWRRPELDPTYGQTALATYQELLNRYPGTDAAVRAQQRINQLNEQFASKAYKAGLFYLKRKAYDSAILYFKNLVATYPKTAVVPAALGKLIVAYRALGYREDIDETCGYLRRYHPGAPDTQRACPPQSTGTT